MNPVYTDENRLTLPDWLGWGLTAGVLIAGSLRASETLLVIGLLLLIYRLLTRHKRYELFPETLVVSYWGPRRTTVLLADIEEIMEVRRSSAVTGILVTKRDGRQLLVRPANPERFLQQLRTLMRRSGSERGSG